MKGLFIPDTIPLQIDIMEDLYMKVKTIRRGDLFYYDFGNRSEEHTSELQSQQPISYAVFCLKKKHKNLEVRIILQIGRASCRERV